MRPSSILWNDEPATEIQVNHLRRLGYEPEHPLTKGEALQLIQQFKHRLETHRSQGESNQPGGGADAWRLRRDVEEAREAVARVRDGEKPPAEYRLSEAICRRQEFWMDTCRGPGKMRSGVPQVFELYMKHGCRFSEPARGQVQEILDALDGAAPGWDREHPELFYQTLEMNFRELLRHTL